MKPPQIFKKFDFIDFFTVASKLVVQPKKDSIVDRVSAMEFCFIYGKCLIFAL